MKQFIKWQDLEADSVNGYGIQIIYNCTSFDVNEIAELRELCKKHIKDGLILEGVNKKDEERK